MTEQTPIVETTLYCAFHPTRETMLRCKRCEKPICSKCARLTPVGYICPECQRGQQKIFETATWVDYPLAIVVGGLLAYLGSIIATRLGFLVLLIGPIIGIGIAEVVRWVIRRRRAPLLFKLSAAAVALGSLINVLILLIGVLAVLASGADLGLGRLGLSFIWQLLYTALVTSSFYYRLSGIQIR